MSQKVKRKERGVAIAPIAVTYSLGLPLNLRQFLPKLVSKSYVFEAQVQLQNSHFAVRHLNFAGIMITASHNPIPI